MTFCATSGNVTENWGRASLSRFLSQEYLTDTVRGTRGPGDKGTRRQGDKETRRQGDKGTRRQGDKETRGQGDKETRRQGDKGTRGQGDKGTRGQGDKETRGQGDKGVKRCNRPIVNCQLSIVHCPFLPKPSAVGRLRKPAVLLRSPRLGIRRREIGEY